MTDRSLQRVVVTGLGVITAIGESIPEFENALFCGRSGIGPITLFDVAAYPCQMGAQVQRSDLAAGFSRQQIKRASRCELIGLVAAEQAIADAQIDPDGLREDRGVLLGGGAGGMNSWEAFRRAQFQGRRTSPGMLISSQPCTLTDRIASLYGFGGYRSTITTACSSSTSAIGMAYDLIRSGQLSMAISGGSEELCELTFGGFNALRVMDRDTCRPFDRDRRGLSLGEGAAILILESLRNALGRGARIYAEVCGWALNSDAYHMTAPHPEAQGMRQVMTQALQHAGLAPEQVGYINAHGTGTPVNDPLETRAIKAVFGEKVARRMAVSSTKSMVGHCLGAAGGIEALATVLAVSRQTAPPTAGLAHADPECDLDYVPGQARQIPIGYALSNSFAFGGNNACVVFGLWDG